MWQGLHLGHYTWFPKPWFNHHWRKMNVTSSEIFSCRVPILDGEYFRQWKDEMLDIFDEFHWLKYVECPYAPPIDPIHPSRDDEIDMVGNLKTVNLIIRGLRRNVLNQLQNFELPIPCGKT